MDQCLPNRCPNRRLSDANSVFARDLDRHDAGDSSCSKCAGARENGWDATRPKSAGRRANSSSEEPSRAHTHAPRQWGKVSEPRHLALSAGSGNTSSSPQTTETSLAASTLALHVLARDRLCEISGACAEVLASLIIAFPHPLTRPSSPPDIRHHTHHHSPWPPRYAHSPEHAHPPSCLHTHI
jgi:hypothetical protein